MNEEHKNIENFDVAEHKRQEDQHNKLKELLQGGIADGNIANGGTLHEESQSLLKYNLDLAKKHIQRLTAQVNIANDLIGGLLETLVDFPGTCCAIEDAIDYIDKHTCKNHPVAIGRMVSAEQNIQSIPRDVEIIGDSDDKIQDS